MSFSAEFMYKIVDRMSAPMKKFRKENEAFAKQMSKNQSIINTTSSKMVNLGKTGERSLGKINTAGKKTEGMLEKLKKKAREVKIDIRSTFKSAGAGLKNAAGKTRTASLVATASIFGMIAAFGAFEKGTKSVFTLMDKPQIEKFGGRIKELEKKAIGLDFGIGESTKAMFDNISGLGANEHALKAYESAIVLAKGGNADLTSSTKGIVAVMNAYELSADRASEVSSALFTAQRFGVTTVQEMSEAIGRLAPISNAAGLSFGEMSSALAIMTKGGLSTDEATTALRATLTSLIKPTKDQQKALKALNIPFGVTGIKAAGVANTFKALVAASKKAPDAIGRILPNVRAMTGALSLSDKQLALMDKTMKKVNEDMIAGTGLGKAYEEMMSGIAADTGKAKGSLTLLAIQLGENLKPIVSILLRQLVRFTDWMLQSPKWFQIVTIAVIALIAVLSPFLAMLGSIATAIAFVGIPMAILVVKIGAIVAAVIAFTAILWSNWDAINAWFDQFGMLGKVIKWIVGGPIFALIAVAKHIVKNWEVVGSFFSSLWDGIISRFKVGIGWIMEKIAWVSNAIGIETGKLEEMGQKLQLGKDSVIRLQDERANTQSKFATQEAPINEFKGSMDINIRDRGDNVESTQSSFMGLDNVGVTTAGAF